jgi:ABC-2 type transport system permease protein
MSGYIFIATIYFFGGIFFWLTSLIGDNASLNGVFSNLLMISVFLTPILTMRLISEEKRAKTDQALFTAPIGSWSIVLGKYFSALMLFVIGTGVTFVYALLVAYYTMPNWIEIIGNFIGLSLMGAALIAVGIFLSSLTESQVVAAVLSYGAAMSIFLIQFLVNYFRENQFLYEVFSYLSFVNHYRNFTMGILNLADTVFFVSVCIFFLFLTARVLEKKKWR